MTDTTSSRYTPRVAGMIAGLLGAIFQQSHDSGARDPLGIVGALLNPIQLVLERCESPIEQMVALAFLTRWEPDGLAEAHVGPVASRWYPRRSVLVGLTQQFTIGSAADKREGKCLEVGPLTARLDFVVEATGVEDWSRLIIECDGHDFHERTKEQAERDRSRDRALTSAGWRVLRFTGREIWRDPFIVVDDVEKILEAEFGGST